MNELEFFREIEGEQQNQEDLVSGAEHLVRLKKQVGLENRRDDDLELEKKADAHSAARMFVSSALSGGTGALLGGHFAGGPGAIAGGVLGLMHGVNSQGNHEETRRDIQLLNDEIRKRNNPSVHETEKDAGQGELAPYLASSQYATPNCHSCKKPKEACLCKMANVLLNARIKTATTAEAMNAIRGGLSKRPYLRTAVLGGATSGIMGGAFGAAAGSDKTLAERAEQGVEGAKHGLVSGATGGVLYHYLNNKLASMREKTASVMDQIKNVHPGLIAATGLGAAAGGIGTYIASRPKADSGKNRLEETTEGKLKVQENVPERGLLSKLHRRNTELEHGYAKAFGEHPGKAALIGAATGGTLGYGLGRLAGAKLKLGGKVI